MGPIAVQTALAEGLCHCLWHVGFREYKARAVLGDFRFHLLLSGDSFSATLLRFSSGNTRVCFSLVGLQSRTDVLTNVDVGDVDRDDLESRLRIEATSQHGS